jgi:hypothetical protein
MDSRAQASTICSCHSTAIADINCDAQTSTQCTRMSSCGAAAAAAGCLQPQPASGENVDLGYEHEQPDEQQQQQSDEHHNCPALKPSSFLDSLLDSTDTVAADSAVKGIIRNSLRKLFLALASWLQNFKFRFVFPLG